MADDLPPTPPISERSQRMYGEEVERDHYIDRSLAGALQPEPAQVAGRQFAQAGQGNPQFAALGAAARRLSTAGGPASMQRTPAVHSGVASIGRAVETLHAEIQQLEDRLTPILRLEVQQGVEGSGKNPALPLPPLAEALQQMADRIGAAVQHIASINQRIEV